MIERKKAFLKNAAKSPRRLTGRLFIVGICAVLMILLSSTGIPGYARGNPGNAEVVKKDSQGFMWVSDPYYVINTGLSSSVYMSRQQAQRVLAALNDSDAYNLGYKDWRFPTAKELDYIARFQQTGSRGPLAGSVTGEGTKTENSLNDKQVIPSATSNDVYLWPVRGTSIQALEFANVVIFGTNSVFLEQNSSISSGDVVANDSSPGPTLAKSVELTVGISVDTSAGSILYADRMFIKSGGVVNGDVYVNTLTNNGQILGTISTAPLPAFSPEEIPMFVEHVPGEDDETPQDVTVESGDTIQLAPGTYNNITVKLNGTVLFTGGEYNFANVDFRDSTTMSFAAASEIRVSEKFATGQNSYIGPESGSLIGASDIVFYVKGINGSSGNLGATPKAAKIGLSNIVQANFYVPNGTLHLKQGTQAEGAFLAKDVDVGISVSVSLNTYFGNRAPVAGADSATVFTGGSTSVLDDGSTSVLDNDYDPDSGVLTVTTTPVSGPSYGDLTLNSDGTFLYEHDGSHAAQDSFIYEVCDDSNPANCSYGQVTITIVPDTVTISITKAGAGSGTVDSSPAGISCGTTCSAQFASNELVYLSATADSGSVFAGWSGDPDCADGLVVPDGDKNCIATFDLAPPPPTEEITLTVTKDGNGSGTVISYPDGIDCGSTCSNTFTKNSRIELEAIPDEGSRFVGWSGDCVDGIVNATGNANCTATFELIPQTTKYTLTVKFLGSGEGNVSGSSIGLFCSSECSVQVDDGTEVTLNARPEFGSTFGGWSGDVSGSNFSITFTMDGNKEVEVTFNN